MNHKKATTNHHYSIWYSTIIDFLYIYYSMFAQMVNQCSLFKNCKSKVERSPCGLTIGKKKFEKYESKEQRI